MKTKEEVLQEVLKDISEVKEVGERCLSFPDIDPWRGCEISVYVTNELDKLGYRLYAFHYESDGKPTGKPSGLRVGWD